VFALKDLSFAQSSLPMSAMVKDPPSAIAFDKARILLQILGIGAVAAIADRVVIYHQGAIARTR
jgi:hypothetical protein